MTRTLLTTPLKKLLVGIIDPINTESVVFEYKDPDSDLVPARVPLTYRLKVFPFLTYAT